MGMKESLMQLREETDKRLAACESAEELEAVLSEVLGRSGTLTGILRAMGKLEKNERDSVWNRSACAA